MNRNPIDPSITILLRTMFIILRQYLSTKRFLNLQILGYRSSNYLEKKKRLNYQKYNPRKEKIYLQNFIYNATNILPFKQRQQDTDKNKRSSLNL